MPLARVSLVGAAARRHAVLARIQDLGVLHLSGPDGSRVPASEPVAVTTDALTALRYLRDVRNPRRPASPGTTFDLDATVARTLANRRARRIVQERIDHLRHQLDELRPWGDAVLPAPDALGGLAVRRLRLGLRQARAFVGETTAPWVEAGRDSRFVYLFVVEPDAGAPPPESRPALAAALAKAEGDLEDLDAERAALTRWIPLIRRDLARADDAARLAAAATLCRVDDELFRLEGWVARRDLAALEELATREGCMLLAAPPAPADDPPTLLDNRGFAKGGERLLAFYTMPAYGAWDPSGLMAGAFAVFFAMIVADAGYALLLWLLVALFDRRMAATAGLRDLRYLAHVTCGVALAYGVMVGSYFGATPLSSALPTALPAALQFLDLADYPAMIRLSVLVGVAHLLVALAIALRRAAAPWSRVHLAGWIALVAGGVAWWLAGSGRVWPLGLVGAGVLLVVIGGDVVRPAADRPVSRVGDGMLALRNVTQLFGDVLSYLRLFALGLASSSLAATFNALAAQAWSARAGAGLLLALLVLAAGHGLNLVLAVVSGVVHGLRLNYIEFLHWGATGEGHAFHPFRRREATA